LPARSPEGKPENQAEHDICQQGVAPTEMDVPPTLWAQSREMICFRNVDPSRSVGVNDIKKRL
jgi:hypothetical protein